MRLSRDIRVHNLSAVGRPARIQGINGWLGELHRAASIAIGLPENSSGKGHVGHEPTVLGEGHRFCGSASQEGAELFALRVVVGELAPGRLAIGKNYASILAGN